MHGWKIISYKVDCRKSFCPWFSFLLLCGAQLLFIRAKLRAATCGQEDTEWTHLYALLCDKMNAFSLFMSLWLSKIRHVATKYSRDSSDAKSLVVKVEHCVCSRLISAVKLVQTRLDCFEFERSRFVFFPVSHIILSSIYLTDTR